ncbi:hypothetical protein ABGB18_21415 [Nonomuraea sp. B12E4]|uniref:hypothetical protein n=1 Tax=Nonomuraea sp. B12E4 TaxID=3153564 RepID=UPI00325EA25D
MNSFFAADGRTGAAVPVTGLALVPPSRLPGDRGGRPGGGGRMIVELSHRIVNG